MSAVAQQRSPGFVVAVEGGRLRVHQNGLQQQLHAAPEGEVCFLSPLPLPALEAVAKAVLDGGVDGLSPLPGHVLTFAVRRNADGGECIAARDVAGSLPLYVVPSETGLTAMSSPTLLRTACPGTVPAVNREALPEYLLFRHVNGPATLFEGVLAPLPGHAITWNRGQASHRPYYALQATFRQRGARTFLSELEPRLQQSLEKESAGQRIGLMLSGGLDSSWLAHARGEHDMALYTVSFPGKASADLEAATQVARGLGRGLRVVHMERGAYAARLPRVIAALGLPVDHPNYVGRHLLFEQAAGDGVGRLLSGDGADTLFGGGWHASIYKTLWVRRLLPAFVGRLPLRGGLGRKIVAALRTSGEDLISDDAYYPAAHAMRLLPAGSADPRASWRRMIDGAASLPPMERAFYMGAMTAPSVDCAAQTAMAWSAGVGIGYPFLDRPVMELANAVSGPRKLAGFRTKALFRQVARRTVPEAVLRRKKCGLPVPLQDFVTGPGGLLAYRGLFDGDDCLSAGLLDRGELDALLARLDRRDGGAEDLELYWVLLNLELWLRLVIRGDRLDRPDVAPASAG